MYGHVKLPILFAVVVCATLMSVDSKVEADDGVKVLFRSVEGSKWLATAHDTVTLGGNPVPRTGYYVHLGGPRVAEWHYFEFWDTPQNDLSDGAIVRIADLDSRQSIGTLGGFWRALRGRGEVRSALRAQATRFVISKIYEQPCATGGSTITFGDRFFIRTVEGSTWLNTKKNVLQGGAEGDRSGFERVSQNELAMAIAGLPPRSGNDAGALGVWLEKRTGTSINQIGKDLEKVFHDSADGIERTLDEINKFICGLACTDWDSNNGRCNCSSSPRHEDDSSIIETRVKSGTGNFRVVLNKSTNSYCTVRE